MNLGASWTGGFYIPGFRARLDLIKKGIRAPDHEGGAISGPNVAPFRINRDVVLKFAGLQDKRGLQLFGVQYDLWLDEGGHPLGYGGGPTNRRRPSSDREAGFFLSILESSVRNSLDRKRRLEGRSDSKVRGLISEVTDIVGVISLSSRKHHSWGTPGGNRFIDFEDYLSDLRALVTTNRSHFPNLSNMSGKEFTDVFINDLTSLYNTRDETLKGRAMGEDWVDWEHERTRDVAALRLWYSPEERVRESKIILLQPLEGSSRGILERGALDRLSADWIEIGFSISEQESYLEFLKSIYRFSMSLTGSPFRMRRVSDLLWAIVVDNGFEQQVIGDWVEYHTSVERLNPSDVPMPIPFESCPLDNIEIIEILHQNITRGRFLFRPRYPELTGKGTEKLIEIAEIIFLILDEDPDLLDDASSLWMEMSSEHGYGRFVAGLLTTFIPTRFGLLPLGNASKYWKRYPLSAENFPIRNGTLRFGTEYVLASGNFSERAILDSSLPSVLGWIEALPHSLLESRVARTRKNKVDLARSFSTSFDELRNERNSLLLAPRRLLKSSIEGVPSEDLSRARRYGQITARMFEMDILESICKMILLFEPREKTYLEDLTVFLHVLEAIEKLTQDRQEDSPLILPEQMYWNQLIDVAESEEGRDEISSFVLVNHSDYMRAAGVYQGRLSRSPVHPLKELVASREESFHSLNQVFYGLKRWRLEGILENLGEIKYESSSEEQLSDSILSKKHLIDEVLEKVEQRIERSIRQKAEDPTEVEERDALVEDRIETDNEQINGMKFRSIRNEVFIEKEGLKRYLSKNGIVSILYGDSKGDGVQITMREITRSSLRKHMGVLKVLFGDLEEYYTPYL